MKNFKFPDSLPDLKKILTPERIDAYQVQAAGLKLLYATERVNDQILQELFKLAESRQVIRQMGAMQAGERVNFIDGFENENRPALHTAMRDVFDSTPKSSASQQAIQELKKLRNFLPKVSQFTTVIQIGIGGSSLGPEAIYLALEAYRLPKKEAHFISNVDPDDASRILKKVDLAKTLIVVVSKSGTTLETKTNEARVRSELKKAGLDPKNHLIAVTGEGSPLDNPTEYLASFYIWDFIGGRYSVTSMVGAVMLSLVLGIDGFLEFLRGAHEMDKVALLPDPQKNLPLMGALLGVWNRNFLNFPTTAMIPYSQALARFPAHLQQLDMESNGKQVDKTGRLVDFETGPVVWGEPGTNSQHSFFQLLHQGTSIVPVEMIGFTESQYGEDPASQELLLANLFAQAIALAQGQSSTNPNRSFDGNRPSRILLAKKLDPKTLGALLAYYEHKVAFQGFLWNINSFDQEGVQLGKKLALQMKAVFDDLKQGQKPSYALGEAYLKQL